MIAFRNAHRRRRMNDRQLVRAFERGEFSAEEMTHRRCIRIGYVYVKRHGLTEAIIRMRAGLKAIDAAQTEDAGTSGYSETWTFAWLAIIYATMQTYGPLPNSRAFFMQHSHLTNMRLLRLYYSPSIWLERDCDVKFVMPDLAPLPQVRNFIT